MKKWHLLALTVLIMPGLFPARAQDAVDVSKFPNPCHLYLQADKTKCIGFRYRFGVLSPVTHGVGDKFRIVPGLATNQGISLESIQHPGFYARHANYLLQLSQPSDNDSKLAGDATFLIEPNPNTPGGVLLHPWSWWPSLFAIAVTRDDMLYVVPKARYDDCTFVIGP